jgi:DMSO/TMAO reductase YedYZ heme-binding membrane subunit
MTGIEAIDNFVDLLNAYVWEGIPTVVKGFVIALVFVVIFRKKIQAHPVAFYIYPIVYAIWYVFYGVAQLITAGGMDEKLGGDNSLILSLMYWLDGLGLGTALGIGLLIIVMFVGVLPKTKLVQNLYTIRTEMSVIGATILVGHSFEYLYRYKDLVAPADGHAFNISWLLMYGILCPILLALLILPWITSFRVLRKRMKASTWKKLQTYTGVPLFVAMLVFGLGINIAWSVGWFPGYATGAWDITTSPWGEDSPIALASGMNFANDILSAKVYAFLLVSYIVLRIKKTRDKSSRLSTIPQSDGMSSAA